MKHIKIFRTCLITFSVAALFLLCRNGPLLAQATWIGNVPSVEKVDNKWKITSAIPDLYSYTIKDKEGKKIGIMSNLFVGTEKGVIDANAIRISEYSFESPQKINAGGKLCSFRNFVFAFHQNDTFYSTIRELTVDEAFSAKSEWYCIDEKGEKHKLTMIKLLSKDKCITTYDHDIEISWEIFKANILKQ